MDTLTRIIGTFDARIRAATHLPNAKPHGLCALYPAGEGMLLPANAEGEFVGFNDSYPLSWYTRLDSVQAAKSAGTGFGDTPDAVEVLNFRTGVFWDRRQVPMNGYEVYRAFATVLAGNVSSPTAYGLRAGYVNMKAAITEPATAFAAEFRGLPDMPDADRAFIALSWELAATFAGNCQPAQCFRFTEPAC